jgi:hypothetical protein
VIVDEKSTVPDASFDEPDKLVFDPVWFVLKRVRPNFHPPSYFVPGMLSVDGRRVRFGPSGAALLWLTRKSDDVSVTFDHVVAVRRERYGWGLVPRFVAITYETDTGQAIAYFNDGGWQGWRPLLTGSNSRMANAIRQRLGLG